MITRNAIRLFLLLSFVLSFGAANAQDELIEETFLLTFIPNIQFAPIYSGIANGYFADAGFSIQVEHLNEPDVVDLVATGRNHFGVVSGEQVVLAAAQDRPIVYVYEWFQQYPVGIAISDAQEVSDISGLAGLKVGIPGRFGATYSALAALLQSADMAESDLQVEEIGFAAAEVMCIGGVDAAVVYVNNEPLQIRNRAANADCGDVSDVTVIPVSDVIDLVSNGIITNRDWAEENPILVQGMVTAWDRALQGVISNPAKAYLQSVEFVENLPMSDELQMVLEAEAQAQTEFLTTEPNREEVVDSINALYDRLSEQFDRDALLQFDVLLTSIALWDAERLGWSELASWENMQDTLLTLGVLSSPIDLEVLFTNDYLPELEPTASS